MPALRPATALDVKAQLKIRIRYNKIFHIKLCKKDGDEWPNKTYKQIPDLTLSALNFIVFRDSML